LPDEQQAEIADIRLNARQIAKIEGALEDREPYASTAEVRAVFRRCS
jgi:hypothetical protein